MLLGPNGRQIGPAPNGNGNGASHHYEDAVLLPLRAAPNDHEGQRILAQRIELLKQAATADNHAVIAPTHVMVRGGQVIGYLSINGMPTVQAWFDSSIKNPRHCKDMIRHGETVAREVGIRQYFIACAKESPFFPRMTELGFNFVGETTFWAKTLSP